MHWNIFKRKESDMIMLMDKPMKSRHTSKIVTKMTVSHLCTWERHARQDWKGFEQSRKQQSLQAGWNMSHGNRSRWRRAVAMVMRLKTHAGIPQQCLGWMKRRGAAPEYHEKGGEEKTIKYKSQPSQAETHTHCCPLLARSTAGQSSWELKTWNYANTALTLACLHRACSWALDLGFVFDILSVSSSVVLNINPSSFT